MNAHRFAQLFGVIAPAALSVALVSTALGQSNEPPVKKPPASTDGPPGVQPLQQGVPQGVEVVEIRRFYIERPPRTVALEGVRLNETIQLFKDRDFRNQTDLANFTATGPAGQLHELPNGMEDSLSSLRWSLPPGVLVIFYEDDGGKGEQLAIWGSGQIAALSEHDFNDKASQWSWYYVGAADSPSQVVREGAALPYGSVVWTPASGVAPNGMQLFKDKNYSGNSAMINSVTSMAANTLHHMPQDLPDSLTSLRWSLPPGVVVMMYQDADGKKQQVAFWGIGQVDDLDIWDFNDKASRWAWYYIGSPEAGALGYIPPDKPNVKPDVLVVDRDSIEVVAKSLGANELRIAASDLRAMKNPRGEGTFVYVPRSHFTSGPVRDVIWLVANGKPFAITTSAQALTPEFSTPFVALESDWKATGITKLEAENESVKIVFEK